MIEQFNFLDRAELRSGSYHPFRTPRVRASVGHKVALAIETDDKHGPPVAIAVGLVSSDHGSVSTFRRDVAHTFSEASVAEFVGAPKKFNGIVGVIRSQRGLHGAEVLIAKR